MITFWMWAVLAFALPPVTEEASRGEIDWTRLQLVATATGSAPGGSLNSPEAMEAAARRSLGPAFVAMAREVPVTSTLRAGELMDAGNAVADRLGSNLSLWEVQEARYFTSGQVELEAALSLQRWLRPALVDMARGRERESPPSSSVSGLVVDARGLDVGFAIAPELRGPDGATLYSVATLTQGAASATGPVIYVSDAADPLGVARAGLDPIFVRAQSVQNGVDLTLSAADVGRVLQEASASPFLLQGKVVVVVSR